MITVLKISLHYRVDSLVAFPKTLGILNQAMRTNGILQNGALGVKADADRFTCEVVVSAV